MQTEEKEIEILAREVRRLFKNRPANTKVDVRWTSQEVEGNIVLPAPSHPITFAIRLDSEAFIVVSSVTKIDSKTTAPSTKQAIQGLITLLQGFKFSLKENEAGGSEQAQTLRFNFMSFDWSREEEICVFSRPRIFVGQHGFFSSKQIEDPQLMLSRGEGDLDEFFRNESGGLVHEMPQRDSDKQDWMSFVLTERKVAQDSTQNGAKDSDVDNGLPYLRIAIPQEYLKCLPEWISSVISRKVEQDEDSELRSQIQKKLCYNSRLKFEKDLLKSLLKSLTQQTATHQLPESVAFTNRAQLDAFLRSTFRLIFARSEPRDLEWLSETLIEFPSIFRQILHFTPTEPIGKEFLKFCFEVFADFLILFDYLANFEAGRAKLEALDIEFDHLSPKSFALSVSKKINQVLAALNAPYVSKEHQESHFKEKTFTVFPPLNFLGLKDLPAAPGGARVSIYRKIGYFAQIFESEGSLIFANLLHTILEIRAHLDFIRAKISAPFKFDDSRVLDTFADPRSKDDLSVLRKASIARDTSIAENVISIQRERKFPREYSHAHCVAKDCKICNYPMTGLVMFCRKCTHLAHEKEIQLHFSRPNFKMTCFACKCTCLKSGTTA